MRRRQGAIHCLAILSPAIGTHRWFVDDRETPREVGTGSADTRARTLSDGVHCLAPDGTLIGKIKVPQTVANLTFGGPKKNRLFITATKSLYSVYVAATGAQTP